ncbi:MAG: hypothetical protein SOV43_06050 [Selenomonadaceae bacterium]|nr:hypothetical protein [Selenomonadaceae bacterium]
MRNIDFGCRRGALCRWRSGVLCFCLILLLCLAAGCGQTKLTKQTVDGASTSIAIDLPFTLESAPQREAVPENPYITALTNRAVTQAKGMPFHLTQFTTFAIKRDALQAKGDAFAQQYREERVAAFLQAFEQNAQITENSRDMQDKDFHGKAGKVVVIQAKMKGEQETIKAAFLPLDDEYWFVVIAYPKEHEEDDGKLADKIFASIEAQP